MTTNDVPAPVPSSLEGFPIVSTTDFLRVTEQAALASARWVGQGDGHSADGAAVDAMRREFSAMPITGTVIIGEGEKDEAPELYVGEVLGTGGMPCEIAVDPLEGIDLVARGDAGAIAVCVIAAPGGVMAAHDMYMQKLCVGAGAKGGAWTSPRPSPTPLRWWPAATTAVRATCRSSCLTARATRT